MKCPAFVWQMGLKGPTPSIWFVPQSRDMRAIQPLQSHDLTCEEASYMTIGQLAAKYPFKEAPAPQPPPAVEAVIVPEQEVLPPIRSNG